jgi:peptidyl-prolyl isomerase D
LNIAKTTREVGNKLFKEGKTDLALQKYQSEYSSYSKLRLPSVQLSLESIRYLDVHPVMPDNSPPELKDSFEALLAPLLLNSALAAIRSGSSSSENANIAVKNTTRALERLELNAPDGGMILLYLSNP